MDALEQLIEFLRPGRRAEEAAAKEKFRVGKIIDAQFDPDDDHYIAVEKEKLANTALFLPLEDKIKGFNQFWIATQEDGSLTYYIRREYITATGTEIKFREINGWEWLTLNSSTFFTVDIQSDASFYFYDTEQHHVVLMSLNDAFVFPDWLPYTPQAIPDVENGEYTLDFKDHEGYDNGLGDSLLESVFAPFSKQIMDMNRKVELLKSETAGKMYLYPVTGYRIGGYYLNYCFKTNGPLYAFDDVIPAISLSFRFIGAYLSFLNKTVFYDPDFISFTDNAKAKQAFFDAYSKLVNSELSWAMTGDFGKALEILYYVPPVFMKQIDKGTLWLILSKALEGDITNFGLNKEDVVLKLIEVLSAVETPDLFLKKLLLEKSGNVNYFVKLYNGMNGENFVRFVQHIQSVWKLSSYKTPDSSKNPEFKDTTGPMMLPYESEKVIGLYFSNASVSLDEKAPAIDVTMGTGKFENISMPDPEAPAATIVMQQEIKVTYHYHPFYPIYIMNCDKAETEIAFDAIIPAFLLKANEDKQFWNNVVTTGAYTLDVVTTLSGVGTLVELRHLATLAEGLSVLSKIRIITGVIEVTSGGLSILQKVTGAEGGPLAAAQEWLFWLELLSLGGELTVALKQRMKKTAKELLEHEDALRKAAKTEEEKEAVEELLEDLKKTDSEAAAVERGRSKGQIIDNASLLKIENFLKKINVELELGPAAGEFEISGYFKNDKPYVMHADNAALFITDGVKSKIVLRENATVYQFLHEFLHLKHCEGMGRLKWYNLGKVQPDGLILRERYVFDNILPYSQYLSRGELNHASWYMNKIYTDNQVREVVELGFDLFSIPRKRQPINIDKILKIVK